MKIECTVEELKEMLIKKNTPVSETTDVSNKLPQYTFSNKPPKV